MEEKHYKPQSDREQDPIYDEITDGINTYASLKSAGLQKRDSSRYAGLCYAPNSVSHYQNVPPTQHKGFRSSATGTRFGCQDE